MKTYDTVVAAINGLKERGYELDFNIAFNNIAYTQKNIGLNPDEFEIVEVYRFEGETNPSDQAVVYAIESKDGGRKGTMVSAYGVYADDISGELIRKLSLHR